MIWCHPGCSCGSAAKAGAALLIRMMVWDSYLGTAEVAVASLNRFCLPQLPSLPIGATSIHCVHSSNDCGGHCTAALQHWNSVAATQQLGTARGSSAVAAVPTLHGNQGPKQISRGWLARDSGRAACQPCGGVAGAGGSASSTDEVSASQPLCQQQQFLCLHGGFTNKQPT